MNIETRHGTEGVKEVAFFHIRNKVTELKEGKEQEEKEKEEEEVEIRTFFHVPGRLSPPTAPPAPPTNHWLLSAYAWPDSDRWRYGGAITLIVGPRET
ncbi:hypothetical protein E2C01_079000 [Portunus trituberculatus]|uniref:Uncharacterized protein n=1 Tax=Portunus trituberculatus TaxID=210409 RepID=A0A5B7IUE6_PORTR|nr:hypothetical protein [Portunus trituberculatus]